MNQRSDASFRAAAEQTTDAATTGRRSTLAAAALITTLGTAMVGATIAAPAADASNPYRVWDRVSACESGHHWHINTGNGFYGGLQFSASTWRAYHGGKYASRADKATRLEQIEVARRVLAAQGPGAWPVCGPRAGLTRSSGHATSARLPRVAGRTLAHHATKRAAVTSHHKAHHKARHKTYRVRPGDTLSKIARRLHIVGGWRALYRANHAHLSNPNVLRAGQLLQLP